MKKTIITLLAVLCILPSLSAGKRKDIKPVDEKIVASKWSLVFGNATLADHYFSNQEYSSGAIFGLEVEHGAFYKRSSNLSWDLDLTALISPKSAAATNPAKTMSLSIYDFAAEYGTSYNWNPVKNLHLRAGGALNFNAGALFCPEGINNVLQFVFQPHLKATAGIKYGWNFKRMGLNLYSDLGIPFMGLMLVGSKYEGTKEIVNAGASGFLKSDINHFKFSSFHNMQGYNLELGLDLQFQKFSFVISYDMQKRWWNAYGVQNYKKYDLFNIGFCVDLISRPRSISNNRYF